MYSLMSKLYTLNFILSASGLTLQCWYFELNYKCTFQLGFYCTIEEEKILLIKWNGGNNATLGWLKGEFGFSYASSF
jgi:hypothetical protein